MVMGSLFVDGEGLTMLASTLHGAVILIKKAKDWDWFINLSSSYYPLMPQDGITLLNIEPFPTSLLHVRMLSENPWVLVL